MTDSFLKLLRCPLCGAKLEPSVKIEESENIIEWGTIVCIGCKTKFPVAFGIPIMKPPNSYIDATENDIPSSSLQKGIQVSNLVRKIEKREIKEVQRNLLIYRTPRASKNGTLRQDGTVNLDNKLSHFLPNALVKIAGKSNLQFVYWVLSGLSFQDRRLRKKEEKVFGKLLEDTSAMGFIYQYYHQLMHSPIYIYFTYRFGQPRYLAALSLLAALPEDQRPILDLACGTGHLIHYLTHRNPQQPVIGLERNFIKLYIAKKFIAPKGNFLCAEADQTLPFENFSFSGVYCSDAFTYFTYRTNSVREMKRIVNKDGIIIITRVPSHSVPERISDPKMTLYQLKSYFDDMQHIVVGEDELMDWYLQKAGPDFSTELPAKELNKIPWMSIAASHRKNHFRNYGQFNDWPHASGRLNINPLYHEDGKDEEGNIILRFKFPTEWYEYENHDWMKYAPETVHLSQSTMNAIAKGIRTPEVNDLISKWVVIGMPEKFLPLGHNLQ